MGSAHRREVPLTRLAIHLVQGRDEIIDPLELAIHGSETDVCHFAHLFQFFQDELPDFGAAHFTSAALLKLELKLLNKGFKPRCIQACFLTGAIEAVEELAAAEDLSVAIALDHCDRNGFDSFVGGEPKLTVQAFTSTTHTSSAISCPRFEHTAIRVLAGRALQVGNNF